MKTLPQMIFVLALVAVVLLTVSVRESMAASFTCGKYMPAFFFNDTLALSMTAARSSPMDRLRQGDDLRPHLCSLQGEEVGMLLSSVMAGCTPAMAKVFYNYSWTTPVTVGVKYSYNGANQVTGSTFSVDPFLGIYYTNLTYTSDSDPALLLTSQCQKSLFNKWTMLESFTASYGQSPHPGYLMGTSLKTVLEQQTQSFSYDMDKPHPWIPVTSTKYRIHLDEKVHQWRETTAVSIDKSSGFPTMLNVTQQTSTDGGANTTSSVNTVFTYNSNNQLVKRGTVSSDGSSEVYTFDYDAQGRVVKVSAPSCTATYVWDTQATTVSVVDEINDMTVTATFAM